MKTVTKFLISGVLATNVCSAAFAANNNPFTDQANVCATGTIMVHSSAAVLMVGIISSNMAWSLRDYNAWQDTSKKIKRFNEIPNELADQNAALSQYATAQNASSVERVSAKIKALEEEKSNILTDLIKQAKLNQTSMSGPEMEKLMAERSEKATKTAGRSRLSRKFVFGSGGVLYSLGVVTMLLNQEVADVLNSINDRSDLERQPIEFKRSVGAMFSGLGECFFHRKNQD